MSIGCDWEQEAAEHLVAIRGQLDTMNAGALDLVCRMDGLIARVTSISACADRINLRLDRIEHRLDRIDAKLH